MPILDIQRRMRQLGEIRIGHVVDTGRVSQRTGKAIKRPEKLNKFRFTSPSRQILEQVAALYGGEVRQWTPANGGPQEWEVYSAVDRLPILIPPRNAVSQWYELYAGSKCIRRCDGVTEQKSDRPCVCDAAERECAITTRVNVMLRDVPALGQWLLITKGYYAATTLPDAAELLAMVGGYVPGWLGMEEKVVQRDQGPSRFMIPTIDVDVSPAQLMSGEFKGLVAGGGTAAISSPERPAIEAAPAIQGQPEVEATAQQLADGAAKATTRAEWRTKWSLGSTGRVLDAPVKAPDTGAVEPLRVYLTRRGAELPDDAAAAAPAPVPQAEPEDGIYDAELVDDTTALWMQVLALSGQRGWSTEQAEREFAEFNGGTMPGSASVEEYQAFLAHMRGVRS